ncbi:MAG: hypothetical protein LBV47_01235 [Bacteroidales bacterium]|jgi:hypothetical protein|nr:hypothetical protein [Bacteroidales bacterium]
MEKFINDFDSLAKAKKVSATNVKLILLFALVVIVLILFFALSSVNTAINKVLVVDRSGEYLKIVADEKEKQFFAFVKNTCALTTHYANSFERKTLKENKIKVSFYCNKNDLDIIYRKYENERAYYAAIEAGEVYKCELESFEGLSGDNEPYFVRFTSLLHIHNNTGETIYRIVSEGELIAVTPQYPENVTGFFFTKLTQKFERVNESNAQN